MHANKHMLHPGSPPVALEMLCCTCHLMQILIQLKRFNQQAQTAMAARSKAKASSSIGSSRPKTKPASGSSPLDQDLGDILGSSTSDKAGVDTSVGGELLLVQRRCGGDSWPLPCAA